MLNVSAARESRGLVVDVESFGQKVGAVQRELARNPNGSPEPRIGNPVLAVRVEVSLAVRDPHSCRAVGVDRRPYTVAL